MATIEQVKTRYRRFAERECLGYSDLYFTLANAVADDDDVSAFISGMPETQPNLFLASIQYLTGVDGMPGNAAQLKQVVNEWSEDIRGLMHSRRTQTNEVGRCAAILPALPHGPLAILEIGASAGLCLLLDKFHYDYGDRQVGDAQSGVHLHCRANNECPVPDAIPEIAWRCGLDVSPVDVMHEDDVNWLLACVWPEHGERRERLRAAIQLAQADQPVVRRGNLVSDLPELIREAPPDLELVIFHSAVLAYVDAEARSRFLERLGDASWDREIVLILNEGSAAIPAIAALAPEAPETQPACFCLGRMTFRDGRRQDAFLAFAQAHGHWLDWRGSPLET